MDIVDLEDIPVIDGVSHCRITVGKSSFIASAYSALRIGAFWSASPCLVATRFESSLSLPYQGQQENRWAIFEDMHGQDAKFFTCRWRHHIKECMQKNLVSETVSQWHLQEETAKGLQFHSKMERYAILPSTLLKRMTFVNRWGLDRVQLHLKSDFLSPRCRFPGVVCKHPELKRRKKLVWSQASVPWHANDT